MLLDTMVPGGPQEQTAIETSEACSYSKSARRTKWWDCGQVVVTDRNRRGAERSVDADREHDAEVWSDAEPCGLQ